MRVALKTLRAAFALLSQRLRRRWLLLIPWALVSAGLELIATAGMLMLIRLISGSEPSGRISLTNLRERMGITDSTEFAALFAVALAVFYLIKNLLRLAETYAQQRCATDTAVSIASGLLERYLRAPYKLHLRRNSSEMLHIVNSGADQVSWVVLQPATALVSEALVVLAILGVLVAQLPSGALGTAAVVVAVMVPLLWLTQHRHTVWSYSLYEHSIHELQSLRQSLAAVKEAKILGREPYFVSRFARLRASIGEIQAHHQAIEVVPRLVVETAFVTAIAVLMLVAWLRSAGGNQIATLGIFAYGGLRLLPSLHLIVYRFNRIGSGTAGIEAVSRDWRELAPQLAPSSEDGRTLTLAHSIVFDSVTFTYEGSDSRAAEPAVRDINLTIQRGESVGIVGPTGSGKTTLVDLMLGLLDPSAGRILVDGQDIRDARRAWQRQIGYVPQNIYLIDDTIRRNIALGTEDNEVDEAQVLASARAAQLEAFLESLPQGLDTVVGERGVKISGGERQRIAIARALYRRPAVLVFDEATAALDTATEQALTATIHALHGDLTLILIAHRLTTVQSCDRLVLLREGRIEDIGPYGELMVRNADFQRLAGPK